MRRTGRVAEVAVVAACWAVLVLGVAVMTLTLPVFTSAVSQALRIPATAGLPTQDALRLSGNVRALVADAEYEPLPATWKGAPAFDSAAVSHLLDVRSVISGARLATGVLALLLAVYVGYCIVRRRLSPMRSGMYAGAGLLVGVIVLAAAAALTDFYTFFAAFHGLFFKAGTWTFPADSLLIRLFPERFWEACGVSWAALSLAGALVLFVAARLTRAAAVRLDASHSANDV